MRRPHIVTLVALYFFLFFVAFLCAHHAMGQQTVALKEGVDLIEDFKTIASALAMDVWWLTILTFAFVWGLRRVLNFVKVDIKKPPRLFEVLSLEEGWWPALRDFLWGSVAVVFAYAVSGIALLLAPQSLPELPWIVFGPIYGLGAIILYLVLKRVGKRIAWLRGKLRAD